jgi:hypothetical protein
MGLAVHPKSWTDLTSGYCDERLRVTCLDDARPP